MFPDEPTDEEEQQSLPEDRQTPFRPADETKRDLTAEPGSQSSSGTELDSTHPATDTNLQPHEVYDEGVSGAAEASEPTAGSQVIDYNPPVADDKEGQGG